MSLTKREDQTGHDLDQHSPDTVLKVAHALRNHGADVIADDIGEGGDDHGLWIANNVGKGTFKLLEVASWIQLQLRGQLATVSQAGSPKPPNIRIPEKHSRDRHCAEKNEQILERKKKRTRNHRLKGKQTLSIDFK